MVSKFVYYSRCRRAWSLAGALTSCLAKGVDLFVLVWLLRWRVLGVLRRGESRRPWARAVDRATTNLSILIPISGKCSSQSVTPIGACVTVKRANGSAGCRWFLTGLRPCHGAAMGGWLAPSHDDWAHMVVAQVGWGRSFVWSVSNRSLGAQCAKQVFSGEATTVGCPPVSRGRQGKGSCTCGRRSRTQRLRLESRVPLRPAGSGPWVSDPVVAIRSRARWIWTVDHWIMILIWVVQERSNWCCQLKPFQPEIL
jgi:hypothetical protein